MKTPEEMAEYWVDTLEKQRAIQRLGPYYLPDDIKDAYLAGYRAAQPKWIKCSERLPEEWVHVLCRNKFNPHRLYVMRHRREQFGDWIWDDEDDIRICRDENITHWLPLPELPKEGE